MALTAAFVVLATYTAERTGAVVAAMVATLPIAAGPAYFFLALAHDDAFIAQSALASLAINAANAAFALTYATLAQRQSMIFSVVPALIAWTVMAAAVQQVEWTLPTAFALNAIVLPVCVALADRLRHAAVSVAIRRWYDIPLRATVVSILVATVVTISSAVGPTVTGIFAVFPIVLTSLMVILHPRVGGKATAAVLANTVLGLVGFAFSCLTAHLTVGRLGTAAGLTLALAVSIACNLAFWAMRRTRTGAAVRKV